MYQLYVMDYLGFLRIQQLKITQNRVHYSLLIRKMAQECVEERLSTTRKLHSAVSGCLVALYGGG